MTATLMTPAIEPYREFPSQPPPAPGALPGPQGADGTALLTAREAFAEMRAEGRGMSARVRVGRPAVCMSRLAGRQARLGLENLRPVQALPGRGAPFDRLADILATGGYRAATIDAPVSMPHAYVRDGGHQTLLERVWARGRCSSFLSV